MNKILESDTIYQIEYDLIKSVKALREKKGWSQRELSRKLGYAESFVGKCESINQPDKYNLVHLVKLKEVFDLPSLDCLFPNGMPEHKLVKIQYKKQPKVKKDGTQSKLSETVEVKIFEVKEDTKAVGNKVNSIGAPD